MGPARQFNRPLPFSFRFLFLTANRLPAESRHSQRFSYSSSVFRRRHRRRGRQEVITRRNANSSNRVVTAVSSNQRRKREGGKKARKKTVDGKRDRDPSLPSDRFYPNWLILLRVSYDPPRQRLESSREKQLIIVREKEKQHNKGRKNRKRERGRGGERETKAEEFPRNSASTVCAPPSTIASTLLNEGHLKNCFSFSYFPLSSIPFCSSSSTFFLLSLLPLII